MHFCLQSMHWLTKCSALTFYWFVFYIDLSINYWTDCWSKWISKVLKIEEKICIPTIVMMFGILISSFQIFYFFEFIINFLSFLIVRIVIITNLIKVRSTSKSLISEFSLHLYFHDFRTKRTFFVLLKRTWYLIFFYLITFYI